MVQAYMVQAYMAERSAGLGGGREASSFVHQQVSVLRAVRLGVQLQRGLAPGSSLLSRGEIGRASCRERV